MIRPDIGKVAPNFTTLDDQGNSVSLKDYRGQIVLLYFYPKAMTPGCTTQACALRDSKKELKKLNVVTLGISPDKHERLKRFKDRDQLNFTLLSDEDHAIADLYGVWGLKKFMGREYDGIHRTSFIINEKGKLVHIMDKFKTKTHHEDALAYIEQELT